jgi:hypothetical protein
MKIQINTYEELIDLAMSERLTPKQFEHVLANCRPFAGIFLQKYTSTKQMGELMKPWAKMSQTERPIFYDAGDMNVKE